MRAVELLEPTWILLEIKDPKKLVSGRILSA